MWHWGCSFGGSQQPTRVPPLTPDTRLCTSPRCAPALPGLRIGVGSRQNHGKQAGGRLSMNFDFSDDLKQLREQARKFLRERCPSAAVRKILEGPEPYDKALWKEIAAMGWTGAAIPEEYGGGGPWPSGPWRC